VKNRYGRGVARERARTTRIGIDLDRSIGPVFHDE
jgi:hypothetical protein